MRKKGLAVLAIAGSLAFGVVACGDDDDGGSSNSEANASEGGGDVSGSIAIDGSSTVAPFAEAAAELCAHRRLACPHHADQHDAAFHRSRSLGVIHRAE